MQTITRAEIQALNADPAAAFAVFEPDGSLYFVTHSKRAEEDEIYWQGQGRILKRIVDTPDFHDDKPDGLPDRAVLTEDGDLTRTGYPMSPGS